MADFTKPISSFFSSPRLFTGLTSKGFFENEATMSPTSILDSKPFSSLRNSFLSEPNNHKTQEPESKRHWDKLDSKGIGLAIVDALIEENPDSVQSRSESRMVLFGSQLKIQIPHLSHSVLSPTQSPKSPADFGIKTRNSQLGSSNSGLSPSTVNKSAFGSVNTRLGCCSSSDGVVARCLSTSEMELLEEYTCVICHGPNPKTTHIFDDCIVESCCGVSEAKNDDLIVGDGSEFSFESFLSFCYTCKKNLDQGKDIYMYRLF